MPTAPSAADKATPRLLQSITEKKKCALGDSATRKKKAQQCPNVEGRKNHVARLMT